MNSVDKVDQTESEIRLGMNNFKAINKLDPKA